MEDVFCEKEIDTLAVNLDGKLFVPADRIDWAKAGQTFKFVTLFNLASGRSINKERFEEVMGGLEIG